LLYIDKGRIVEILERCRPFRVLVSAPPGLLNETATFFRALQRNYNLEVIMSGESCYGICDTLMREVDRLGADLYFHIGHNVSPEKLDERTYLIDAYDTADFSRVISENLPRLRSHAPIGLCAIGPHLHELGKVKDLLESNGFAVFIGKGHGILRDGQVMGCDYSACLSVAEKVSAFVFLGSSAFHAIGLSRACRKPAYMVDPYLNSVESMDERVRKTELRRLSVVLKSLDGNLFGIIIGLKEGQLNLKRALDIKKRLEQFGRKALLIAMSEITEDKLLQFRDVDVFIETACPRLVDDIHKKLVLNEEEAYYLLNLLSQRTEVVGEVGGEG